MKNKIVKIFMLLGIFFCCSMSGCPLPFFTKEDAEKVIKKRYPKAVFRTVSIPWGWPNFISYVYEIGIPQRYNCLVRAIQITRRQRIQPVDNSHRSDDPLSQRQQVKYTKRGWETVFEYDNVRRTEELIDGKCFVKISSGR